MPAWQVKLRGCFGVEDRKFGFHSSDEQRGKALKQELDSQGVVWARVEKEIRETILNDCRPAHVEAELKTAKRMLYFEEVPK